MTGVGRARHFWCSVGKLMKPVGPCCRHWSLQTQSYCTDSFSSKRQSYGNQECIIGVWGVYFLQPSFPNGHDVASVCLSLLKSLLVQSSGWTLRNGAKRLTDLSLLKHAFNFNNSIKYLSWNLYRTHLKNTAKHIPRNSCFFSNFMSTLLMSRSKQHPFTVIPSLTFNKNGLSAAISLNDVLQSSLMLFIH